jgi:hypothetical protein
VNAFKSLWPAAWQKPAPLENDELLKLWVAVPEQDPCLRAVRELLGRHLLESAMLAGSINTDDTTKLRACERMECFRMLLLEIEAERKGAEEWAKAGSAGVRL